MNAFPTDQLHSVPTTSQKKTPLPPLQTSFNARPSQRLHRPRAVDQVVVGQAGHHQVYGSKEPDFKRRTSRAGLLSIFGRGKGAKYAKTIGQSTSPCGDLTSLQSDLFDRVEITHASGKTTIKQNIRTASIGSSIPSNGQAKTQEPKTVRRSMSLRKEPGNAKSVPWDPPPLFQAYPQAVKHATLCTPNLSADAILRLQRDITRKANKKDNGLKEDANDGRHQSIADIPSETIHFPDWSRKIFVLATSGYFLQYAGEGTFDRLPEKVMPIGKDSAAFASDAIPGKHWVLQVSHASDEDGTPRIDSSKPFFKKLGFKSDMKRCSASNILLVLEAPEDLEAWLAVVRKEIDALGGRRYRPDTAIGADYRDTAQSLQPKPSRRYLVKRDPNQFSSSPQDTNAKITDAIPGKFPTASLRKHSTATEDSINSPSMSNATTSTDQHTLDRLRNSPRMSYISTGAKTHSTTRDSSPAPSPMRPVFHLEDFDLTDHEAPRLEDENSLAKQIPVHRLSQSSTEARRPLTPPRPMPAIKNSSSQTSFSGATNFSVPSFSKRYSSAHGTPLSSSASSWNSASLPQRSLSPSEKTEHINEVETSTAPGDLPVLQPDGLSNGALNRVTGANAQTASTARMSVPLDFSPASTLSVTNTVPRRFSSLEYSRGISPTNLSLATSPSPTPHPPPTSTLPALPPLTESNASLLAPSRKLRRPVSMQVHSHSTPMPSKSQVLPSISDDTVSSFGDDVNSSTSDLSFMPPPGRLPPPPPPPSLQQMKIQNRKSMPQIGRPLYDPPDCPLPIPPVPSLPPIQLSTGSLRRTMERPLRAC